MFKSHWNSLYRDSTVSRLPCKYLFVHHFPVRALVYCVPLLVVGSTNPHCNSPLLRQRVNKALSLQTTVVGSDTRNFIRSSNIFWDVAKLDSDENSVSTNWGGNQILQARLEWFGADSKRAMRSTYQYRIILSLVETSFSFVYPLKNK